MSVGDTRTVTISINSKVGLMLFDGTAGGKVSLLVWNSTLSGVISLFSTAGAVMASINSSSGSFVDAKSLAVTGTYTILITPFAGTAGSVTLTLTDVTNDATATLVPAGPPATVTIAPSQNSTLTFNGSAGQRVSVFVSTPFPINSAVTLLDPDGALVFTTTATTGQLGDVVRKLSSNGYEYLYQEGGSMRFDSSGRLTAMVDRNGNTTTLTYAGGNLTQITDPVGRSITLSYGALGQIIQATDPLGRTWHYSGEAC